MLKKINRNIKGNLIVSVIFIMSGLLVFASILLNKSNKILGNQQGAEMGLQSKHIAESLLYKTQKEYQENIPKNIYKKTYDICLNYKHEFSFEKPIIDFLNTNCDTDASQQKIGETEVHAYHKKPKIQRYLDRYKEFSYPFENKNLKIPKSLKISWWNELLEKSPPIEITLTHPCPPASPSVIPEEAGIHTDSPEILKQVQDDKSGTQSLPSTQPEDDKTEYCTTNIAANNPNIQYFQGKNTYAIPDTTNVQIQFKSLTEPIYIELKNSEGNDEKHFLEDSLLFIQVDVKVESENNAFAPIEYSIERNVTF